MAGWALTASPQARASRTVKLTPRDLAACCSRSGWACMLTRNRGMVSASCMLWATARSREDISRSWPGMERRGATAPDTLSAPRPAAASTSAAVISPSGPVPVRRSRSTLISRATTRE